MVIILESDKKKGNKIIYDSLNDVTNKTSVDGLHTICVFFHFLKAPFKIVLYHIGGVDVLTNIAKI